MIPATASSFLRYRLVTASDVLHVGLDAVCENQGDEMGNRSIQEENSLNSS